MASTDPSGADLINPDAPDLKRHWTDTGDVRFAAMAIGRWPADPPPWAVIACYAEHQRWQRGAERGNNKAGDGAVLDEVIRVYFRLQDEARGQPGYSPSGYEAPAQGRVIALALLNAEGLHPDHESFRARLTSIDRRLDEEAEQEGYPERASDGARTTARYQRMLQEWGEEVVGAPTYLHSFLLYISGLVEGE